MSWMIKGGSSSALEQSPLDSLRNELTRRVGASSKQEASTAPRNDCVDGSRWGPREAGAPRAVESSWTVSAAGGPRARGSVYPSEGFG
jgi:hypothetical protein